MSIKSVGTPAELLTLARPFTLSTQHMQSIFLSGAKLREWSKDNGIKVKVHKGSVEFS